MSKPTGRVTPRKATTTRKDSAGSEKWEVTESRSVRSAWIWRGFLILALVAAGFAILMETNHHGTLGALWLVIAAGWFGISMWLWRMHSRYVNTP